MDTMNLIFYGGVVLGVGVICSLGYRIVRRKRTEGGGEKPHVANKISEFYSAQDASRDRFEI